MCHVCEVGQVCVCVPRVPLYGVLCCGSKRVRMPRVELGISQPQCNVLTTILHAPGEAGYRSQYLAHAKRALYHLSYIPITCIQTHRQTQTPRHTTTHTTHVTQRKAPHETYITHLIRHKRQHSTPHHAKSTRNVHKRSHARSVLCASALAHWSSVTQC